MECPPGFSAWKTHPFWPHIPNMTQYGNAPRVWEMLIYSRLQLKCFKHPLRIPLKLNFFKYFNDKTVVFNKIITGLLLLRTHGCKTLSDSRVHSLAKSTGQSFSDFELYAAVKLRWLSRKIFPPDWSRTWYRGKLMFFNISKKGKVSSNNLWDKLQFVNLAKRLVFDLTEIPFFKCLINIYRLIAKVLNDQNLFTESNLVNWFSSYVQFCSGGHFSKRAEPAL